MRWSGRRRSTNVEDRRGGRPAGRRVAFGGGSLLVIVLLAVLFGADPGVVLQIIGGGAPPGAPPQQRQVQQGRRPAADDPGRQFVELVLAATEDVWREQFQRIGRTYREPKLVIYSGQTPTGCGIGSAAVGPFYCPVDQTAYIDLSFYRELELRHNAPGDFAQAYVLAHEIGHHVQNLLGTMEEVQAVQQRVGKRQANELSVRLELQADFYAGVWAHHAHQEWQILEPGDIEEGIRAAMAIGDDRLQMEAQGYVVPARFTHGTSEQRVRWFRKGFRSGNLEDGDTFEVDRL